MTLTSAYKGHVCVYIMLYTLYNKTTITFFVTLQILACKHICYCNFLMWIEPSVHIRCDVVNKCWLPAESSTSWRICCSSLGYHWLPCRLSQHNAIDNRCQVWRWNVEDTKLLGLCSFVSALRICTLTNTERVGERWRGVSLFEVDPSCISSLLWFGVYAY